MNDNDRSDRERPGRGTFRRDFYEETGFHFRPLRWVAGFVGIALVAYVLLALAGIVGAPFGVARKVTNPDRVIFAYEHFHDTCGAVVALDQQYKTALKTAEAFDKRTKDEDDPLGRNADESSRLHQDAAGIALARQEKAQQYNADSRKYTQAVFKQRSLPYRIEDGVTPSCDG